MSSAATVKASPSAPVIETQPAPTTDEADRSYGRAVTIGSVLGIFAFIAVLWVAVKLLAPGWSVGASGIIAVWTGLWCGLFLGGTIAVGRWSQKQGH